jgi:hypothetical protein
MDMQGCPKIDKQQINWFIWMHFYQYKWEVNGHMEKFHP